MSQGICSNCHTVVPEGAKFCTQCGAVSEPAAQGDDATTVIPTGSGPGDATAVIPTGPPVRDKVYDPNATIIGAVPPAPVGGDSGQPAPYGQPSYPPPAQSYPPPPSSPGASSYPPAPSYPPADQYPPAAPSYPPAAPSYAPADQYPPAAPSYPPSGASYPPAGASYPPAGPSYPPAGPSYSPSGASYPPQGGGDQQWSGYAPGQQQQQPWAGQQGPKSSTDDKAFIGGILAIVAGIAAIAGAFLPWARTPLDVASGWDISDDAKAHVALGAAAIVVGIALLTFATGTLRTVLRLAAAGLGIAILAVTVIDIMDIMDLPEVLGIELGSGLFVLVGAGVVLLLSAIMPLKKATA